MKPARAAGLALALPAWLVIPGSATGQGIRPSGGASVIVARVESRTNSQNEQLSGTLLGGEGRVARDRLLLDVRYFQGRVEPRVTGRSRDVVEGEAMVGVRLVRWAVLRTGPRVRTLITPQQSERWLAWDVRARGEAALASSTLRSYVEFWGVLAGSVNTGETFNHGTGVEAGLMLSPASSPLWGRIGYRLDRGSVDGGARRQTVQGLILTAGVGRR